MQEHEVVRLQALLAAETDRKMAYHAEWGGERKLRLATEAQLATLREAAERHCDRIERYTLGKSDSRELRAALENTK